MTYGELITLFGIVLSNSIVLVIGVIHFAIKLTRIETDVKWIKQSCPNCEAKKE